MKGPWNQSTNCRCHPALQPSAPVLGTQAAQYWHFRNLIPPQHFGFLVIPRLWFRITELGPQNSGLVGLPRASEPALDLDFSKVPKFQGHCGHQTDTRGDLSFSLLQIVIYLNLQFQHLG